MSFTPEGNAGAHIDPRTEEPIEWAELYMCTAIVRKYPDPTLNHLLFRNPDKPDSKTVMLFLSNAVLNYYEGLCTHNQDGTETTENERFRVVTQFTAKNDPEVERELYRQLSCGLVLTQFDS